MAGARTLEIGERFGKRVVISEPVKCGRRFVVRVRCDCGDEATVITHNLLAGSSRACRACAGKKRQRPLALGSQHGRWTVVSDGFKRGRLEHYLCRCECGRVRAVTRGNLIGGRSRGCASCASTGKNSGLYKHGRSGTREWIVWSRARILCAERGLPVCPEWTGKDGFATFLADVGEAPPGRTLVVIDPSRGFVRGNVRWGSRREAARAGRARVPLAGRLTTLTEIGEPLGITREGIRLRLRAGWTPEEAATTPKGVLPERVKRERAARRAAQEAAE